MRIGDEVIRIKGEWNECTVGHIAVIDGMKIYNGGLVIHLKGDKEETFHSGSNYRLTQDVNMDILETKLAMFKEEVDKRIAKAKATKKQRKKDQECVN